VELGSVMGLTCSKQEFAKALWAKKVDAITVIYQKEFI
jgi:hypothetical protein